MIRVGGLSALVFLGAAVACADEQGAPGAPINLIENPSFESASNSGQAPDGWSLWTDKETGYRCEASPGGREGNCLKVEGAGTRAVVFARGVPIDRSKRYALRGWAKLDGKKGARALVLFHYFHEG